MNTMLTNADIQSEMPSIKGMMTSLPLDLSKAFDALTDDMELTIFAMHQHSNGDSTLASSDDLRVDFYDVVLMDRGESEDDVFLVEIDNLSLNGASMYCDYLESKLDVLGEWL